MLRAIDPRACYPGRVHTMLSRRKPTEASLRSAERRQREDAAERLLAQIPALVTLELAIEEGRGGVDGADTRHVRRVVVERAPALFDLPCTERTCVGGGHDVTRGVMAALQAREVRFEGEHKCAGQVGTNPCGRVLRYVGTATWRG
jgi:hypothetical protein